MQIEIDFPFLPIPRYGHGKPAHPALLKTIEHRRENYRRHLKTALSYRDSFARIPSSPSSGERAKRYWRNDQFSGLDAVMLYALLCEKKPERFVEIGSGNSTILARRAIQDSRLPTKLVSIDPHPREYVDSICDEVVRAPLEDTDLRIFEELTGGDFVFVDGSHRSFMNSDVTVFFLEVLPLLRPGVWVHLHDIYLPFDYPPDLAGRFYSEQYLLACYLLSGSGRLEVELPNAFISQDEELLSILDPVWTLPQMQGIARHGVSFWVSASGCE